MTEHRVSKVQTTQEEPEQERRIFTFKATQVIWLLLGILEVMLALRFVLKLIAANPASPIAAAIYSFTDLFLFPFAGLTATPAVGGMVLEISTLIAMAIYFLSFPDHGFAASWVSVYWRVHHDQPAVWL